MHTDTTLLDIAVNDIRTFVGEVAPIKSLNVSGSADDDALVIDDINGLPVFAGAIPTAEDNPNITGQPHILLAGGAGSDALYYVSREEHHRPML